MGYILFTCHHLEKPQHNITEKLNWILLTLKKTRKITHKTTQWGWGGGNQALKA